jgi:hypothetical protein
MATMRNIEETHATSCCCCETGKNFTSYTTTSSTTVYLFILAKTDGIEGIPVAQQTAAAFCLGI